ncbi:Mbov_0400 family ICE element protein [Mesomycoplasma ovipneumoniae]|uniref:Mbov_0400 family ICE element protein n=1 Tax=Mesomycoplasma ovipneumoniae TaxID=29562 RepID=UPI003081058F
MAIKDWIKNSKLAKFIPFKLKRTLVFDSLGQRIDSRSVIIFRDIEDNYYYYIKARDARLTDWRLKKRIDGEVLISKSNKPNTLFTKDFYLDYSQIFYIHGSQLDELIKNHPKTEILDSKELEFDQVKKMFEKIYECLTSEPPHIVISKVSYDSKRKNTKSDVQYASDWHLENDYDRAVKENSVTQKIKELKDRLKKDKDIVELENLEIILRNARRKHNQEKIYNPLFDWITQNKFMQKGLNSLEIFREYRKLLKPIVPINVDAIIIYSSLLKNDLAQKLIATDYKFMFDWFKKMIWI